jgi:dimethylaniline monooxygenase (N-oxide forming)
MLAITRRAAAPLGARAAVGVRHASHWTSSLAHVKRVGVIGGGVAGLQTARSLLARGITPVIFESSSDIGGVWRSNYDGFGLQVPKQLYEFPDFPMTEVARGEYPTGAQIQSYIKRFAAESGVAPVVRLNTAVKAVAPRADGKRGWTFTTSDGKTEDFDFAVVSSGMYGTPSLPSWPAAETFAGKLVHSTDFTDRSVAAGKQLVVVGGGKSAIDCAVGSSGVAAKTTLLYRSPHWGTPRKIAGLIPFQYVFLSRFGQALVSWYKGALPTASGAVKAAHAVLRPIMGPIFGIVEALFAFQLGQSKALNRRPALDVVADFYGFAHVLDSSLKDAINGKKVDPVQGAIASLTPTGAVLADGRTVAADVIVCGTGFRKSYDFLPPAQRAALDVQKDGLYLYRQALPVDVPDLAFVGGEVATIFNVTASGLQAEWLARALAGEMRLPEPAAMRSAIDAHKEWARGWMPATDARANLVLLHQVHWYDALCRDMGVPHRRKGANVLAEILYPYHPADYNGIIPKPAKKAEVGSA